FQSLHGQEWDAVEAWLGARLRPRMRDRQLDPPGLMADHEFPAAYRRVCQQLALAERRAYSTLLLDRLRDLVHRGHLVLYRPPPVRGSVVFEFVAAEFPRLVRRHWRAMAVAAVLFFVPMFGFIATLQVRPELAHTIFEPERLAEYEEMYDPANSAERMGRDDETDLMMFGLYVWNNVTIGFQTFASGLVFCVPSVWVVARNGVFIGAVAGHLTAIGYGGPFWRFVATHSAPELLALVISGGAGLQIGMAVLAPGRRTRGRALVEAGRDGGKLALGVFAMLVFAAFIEAYWSSRADLPDPLRFGVAGALWFTILAWLAFGGRNAPPKDEYL
ncbi:MAG TPA: stage II sporulation protein M, partial [Xanthomonadales bacterium]|nr:stage II sporulation protein M [Xanthomonadales bacterium]